MDDCSDQEIFIADDFDGSKLHVDGYIEEKEFKRFKKKVGHIFGKTGICKKCPDRYKALTKGKECCVYLEDDE